MSTFFKSYCEQDLESNYPEIVSNLILNFPCLRIMIMINYNKR